MSWGGWIRGSFCTRKEELAYPLQIITPESVSISDNQHMCDASLYCSSTSIAHNCVYTVETMAVPLNIGSSRHS